MLEQSYLQILKDIGENPERAGLAMTPVRAARTIKFLTRGYEQKLEEIVNEALFPSNATEMIVVQDIELYSLCEHHLLPFIGKCHVAYLPNGKILGLSKIARIVDMYARRLQIQESLTQEIAHAIINCTQAHGAGVIIEARHLCMMMRGVEKQNSIMKTSCMLGNFETQNSTRQEFLSLLNVNRS